MSTLVPSNTVSPRADKLQSLEAKMASIEVSLGWRRRREALLETLPRAARDLVRELDSLHQTVRDKDVAIESLKGQITKLGGIAQSSEVGTGNISENERQTLQDRLNKVQSDIEAKKIAVKNLKLTLDKIDVTENIDVRIRAAELEFELEREELNILNLKEESTLLSGRLQDNTVASSSQKETKKRFFSDLIDSSYDCATLVAVKVSYTPGNPPFHVQATPLIGCYVDWATEETGLRKGDRILEINEEVVFGTGIESITKFMSTSGMLSIIVCRQSVRSEATVSWKKQEKQLEDKQKENKDLVARLDKALRERDTNKIDNTRLKHRISYLEDQVNDLQQTIVDTQETPPASSVSSTENVPSQPGATIIQVYQRGPQTLAVASSPKKSMSDDTQSLSRVTSPHGSSTCSGKINKVYSEENLTEHTINKLEKFDQTFTSSERSYTPNSLETDHQYIKTQSEEILFNLEHRKDNQIKKWNGRKCMDREDAFDKKHIKQEHRPNIIQRTSYKPLLSSRQRVNDNLNVSSSSSDIITGDQMYGYSGKHKLSEYPRDYKPVASRRPTKEQHKQYNNSYSKSGDMRVRKTASNYEELINKNRPVPPKKPERLSLHRATSLQNVDDTRPNSRLSAVSSLYPETVAGEYASKRDKKKEFRNKTHRPIETISERSYPMPTPRMHYKPPQEPHQHSSNHYDTLQGYMSRLLERDPHDRSKSPNSSRNISDDGNYRRKMEAHRNTSRTNSDEFLPLRRTYCPPTPNTPPRGISLPKSNRNDNVEWC